MFELLPKKQTVKNSNLHTWINYKKWMQDQKNGQYKECFGIINKWYGVFSMNLQFNTRQYKKLVKNNYELLSYIQS